MTNDASRNHGQDPFAVHNHKFALTIFPDTYAKAKTEQELTLPQLAELISNEVKRDKSRLPWLKMATFGNILSMRGKSYRSDDNVTSISGIEIDYDGDAASDTYQLTPEAAIARFNDLGVRALVYTTASHRQPGKGERWRALLPLSVAVTSDIKAIREKMVARVNGVFDGQIDQHASFTLSQAFYYGKVRGKAEHFACHFNAAEYFIDNCDDLDEGALPKQSATARAAAKAPRVGGQGHTIPELQGMLDAMKASGEDFHEVVMIVTASLAGKRWSREDIELFIAGYVDDVNSPQVANLIDGALMKFNPSGGASPALKGLQALADAAPTLAAPPVSVAGKDPPPVPPPSLAAPSRPPEDAPFAAKVDWLIATRGFCATDDRVVDLYATSLDCESKLSAMRTEFSHWHTTQVGARGGTNMVRAVDGWLNREKMNVAGVRMRPDRPFPVYREGEALYKNTYRAPLHSTEGGVIAPFMAFLDRLIPDITEREFLLKWMAHKRRYPWVPGAAIVFRAFDEGTGKGVYGTGRGTLFKIARALYGADYVTSQSFAVIDGTSSQAAFSDWLHGAILVTCSESQTADNAHHKGARRGVYARLRELVEPAEGEMTRFTRKGLPSFMGPACATFWLATNHYDAIAMDTDDRRFSVLSNGRRPTDLESDEINAWRSNPANIGVLAECLDGLDLTGFNIREPMVTNAKTAMVNADMSEIEGEMLDLIDAIEAGERGGVVFTKDNLRIALRNQNVPHFEYQFEAAWRSLVVPAMGQNSQRRIRTGGTRKKLYCFRRMAERVKHLSETEVHEAATRWSPPIGTV